ncbi:MAG TPA: ribonuclease E inhibitor RraB [Methylomirabilota bacterium]|jgi:hypothetical protein
MAISIALSAAILILIGVLLTRRPREQSFTVAVAAPIAEQVTGLAARSAEFLAILRDRGLDLNAPRQIDLHFVANTERSAKDLMRSLRSEFPGSKLELSRSDPADSMRPPWRVTCVVQAPVSAIVQPPAIEHRVRVATSVGAVHDGWGTAVDKR